MSTIDDQLRELIAQWRDEVKNLYGQGTTGSAMLSCANDIEVLLAARERWETVTGTWLIADEIVIVHENTSLGINVWSGDGRWLSFFETTADTFLATLDTAKEQGIVVEYVSTATTHTPSPKVTVEANPREPL